MANLWTTQNISEPEQFGFWREVLCDAFVPLDPECDDRSSFTGRIDGLRRPGLKTSTVIADAHYVQLSRGGIARQRGEPFFLNLLCRGKLEVHQNGEAQVAKPGDVFVVDSSAPWAINFATPFEIFCIELDESMLRPRLGSRGRMVAPVMANRTAPSAVLSRYLRLISESHDDDVMEMQSILLDHCVTLLTRANAAAAGTAVSERDQRQSLHDILAYMHKHLTEPELTVDQTCQALKISRSYLYKVLAEAGYTFAGFLRQCRLQGCRQTLLANPEASVAQIAHNWGFSDASSFNRAYRREYGESPSMTRQKAGIVDTSATLVLPS